jgi:hypothetical protein
MVDGQEMGGEGVGKRRMRHNFGVFSGEGRE